MAFAVAALVVVTVPSAVSRASAETSGYQQVSVEGGTQFAYVVYRALDRDGFCDAGAFGAVSLHPVLTDTPNDTLPNDVTGQPNPRHTIDFLIDGGDGVIVETSAGRAGPGRFALGVPTYSLLNRAKTAPQTTFAPLVDDAVDECQAWVKVASASGQPVNVLVVVHADEGDLGFDRIVNFGPSLTTVALTPGWNLVTWQGADGADPAEALGGAGGGNDISASVGAVMAWDSGQQAWDGYYAGGDAVPGANDLASLKQGQAYWVAVSANAPVAWQVPTAD